MNPSILRLLALASLFAAGNIYYAQPLLNEIAHSFTVGPKDVGLIPVLGQVGYVTGLIFLSPLADVLDNKYFLIRLLFAEVLALTIFAFSNSLSLLFVSSFALGFSSILTQVAFPLVASLSSPKERAKNLGLMISSALVGILISRAVSGWIGGLFSWRIVYILAAIILTLLAFVLKRSLPAQPPRAHIKYKDLLLSLFEIYKTVPGLRIIALNGALLYAALSSFWASLAFYLKAQFNLGAEVAGTFGLIGALGAMTASLVGRYINLYGSKKVIMACMSIMALSFIIMGLSAAGIAFLVIGVITLDVGAQAATVTNQNELYSLHDSAQARLNTIYKVCYFSGGALGSYVSVYSWVHWGWSGVCLAASCFILLAFVVEITAQNNRQS